MPKEKILLSWSGGKDCAYALHHLLTEGEYEVIALLTTVTRDYDRISMHGVPTALLEQQALSIGIALEKVFISKSSSNEEYERQMTEVLQKYSEQGVRKVAFGDIFLEDIRKYRENNLFKVGMSAIFPNWLLNTREMADSFIKLGFCSVITCVDSTLLDKTFAGRNIDSCFVSDIPEGVDVCGENGEYHSFVYDGPIFKNKILFTKGDIMLRDERFYYCDLIPFCK